MRSYEQEALYTNLEELTTPSGASYTDRLVGMDSGIINDTLGVPLLNGVLTNQSERSNNVTSRATPRSSRSYYKEEQVGFLIFLFVGIVIANGIVLAATICSKRGHKSRMTFFIMHLAIADLMVGLVSVLTDLLWKVTEFWYAGNIMCHLLKYLQGVAMFASTYVMVALSIDRLDAIARPMNFRNSRTRARVLIAVAWISSGLMALPLMILFRERGDPEHRQCSMHLSSMIYWKLYVTLLAASLFFIPTIIVIFCYCVIIYVIWSKANTATVTKTTKTCVQYGTKFTKQVECDAMESSQHRSSIKPKVECKRMSGGVIPQAKIKTIKLTFVIVTVFIICWSPYFFFNLLDVYGCVPSSPNKRAITILIGSFAPLNSLANPIIYGIFTTMIGKSLRRIGCFGSLTSRLCCCCPCSQGRLDKSGSFNISTRQTYVFSPSATEMCPRRLSQGSTRNKLPQGTYSSTDRSSTSNC